MVNGDVGMGVLRVLHNDPASRSTRLTCSRATGLRDRAGRA